MTEDDSFALANRAFDMFTLPERKLVLEAFSRLHYQSIADRWIDAVHAVITRKELVDKALR